MRKLRVGIVGAGMAGRFHLECLRRVYGVEVASPRGARKAGRNSAWSMAFRFILTFRRCRGTDIRIEINGVDGTGIMMGERMSTWKFRDERPEDVEIRNYGNASQSTGAGGAADFGHLDHMVVIQDMVDAINENREVVIPGFFAISSG